MEEDWSNGTLECRVDGAIDAIWLNDPLIFNFSFVDDHLSGDDIEDAIQVYWGVLLMNAYSHKALNKADERCIQD